MNLIVEGIKYQLHAKKRQGIHSPFIYDLVDKGLTRKVANEHKTILKAFDQKQRTDRRLLSINDLGAGSKTLGDQRSVKQIHKTSSSGKRYGTLLYRLCKQFEPSRILELEHLLAEEPQPCILGIPKHKLPR